MKLIHKGKDIAEIVTSIRWSGDYKQAARTLEFGIAVHPHAHDAHLPKVTIKMEDVIILQDDEGNELFQGFVFFKEKSINSNEMTITAYDGLIYLLQSEGVYNFKNMTPQAITQKVCNDFGIPVGDLAKGSPLSRVFPGENIYNIIMTAYTIEAKKSGRLFMPRMDRGRLNVIEKGKKVVPYQLDPETSITGATYSESIENSINRVKIYDENNNPIGEVRLDGFSGILQAVYHAEKGVDPKTMAKAMLKGVERMAEIEALGNVECIVGNAVIIKEPHTGLVGLFYIDNDEHVFANGQHTMRLGLSFQNVMDEKEGGEAE